MTETTSIPTITIIDDARDFQVQLTHQIKSWQPRSNILTAKDVASGLKCIGEKRPDLLLLDLRLGGDDGIEILKAFPKERRIFPILVVTGDARAESFNRAFQHGADDYISKPIDELILRSKIESLLQRRYFSPLKFFGTERGFAPIEMGFKIVLHYLSEEKIEFLSPVMFAKGASLKVSVGDHELHVKVRRASLSTNDDRGFFISAGIEEGESQAATRRLILKILSAAKGPSFSRLMVNFSEVTDESNKEHSR
ncbi:MAG: response regulator [Parcubacteria group bacterium]|nr:response regulator [Parcubacteria group bacterium]